MATKISSPFKISFVNKSKSGWKKKSLFGFVQNVLNFLKKKNFLYSELSRANKLENWNEEKKFVHKNDVKKRISTLLNYQTIRLLKWMIQIFWIILEIITNCFIRKQRYYNFSGNICLVIIFTCFLTVKDFFSLDWPIMFRYLVGRKSNKSSGRVYPTFKNFCLSTWQVEDWEKLKTKNCGLISLKDWQTRFKRLFSANKMIRNVKFSRVLTLVSQKLSWKQTFQRNSKILFEGSQTTVRTTCNLQLKQNEWQHFTGKQTE